MSLPRFGVTHPVPVNLLMAATIAAGIYSAFTLRREFFPESEPEQAMVTLPYPGATPQEIEESMARKVEDAIAELDEVERLETTISEGSGGVLVEFREGVNVDKAVDEVERAVDALTDLPAEAEEIRVTEFEPNLPVIMVTLYGQADEETLKTSIRRIRDDLKRLPGMGEIMLSGVREYEMRIDVSEAALLEHGISLPHVADAVRAWMQDVPGGTVRTGVGNINVRTMGVAERAEAIRQIVVKATPQGQSLRVGDIGTVREDFVDDLIERRFNGEPSVSLTCFKTGEQDAVQIAETVRAYAAGRMKQPFEPGPIERIGSSARRTAWEMGYNHPEALPGRLATHSDLARFIEGRLALLSRNAGQGAVLVFLTLLLFLNWRAAFWVMTGLLTALCGTIVVMSWLGVTLNLLTMFGLIIVIGMLVDDAIVVAENIQSRHDRGETSLHAAIKGAEQVFWPVVGTVTTTIVAFVPLTFVSGRIGDLLGALPLVVGCALAASLIESVLILPAHVGHSLVKRDKAQPGRWSGALRRFELARDGFIERRVLPGYERLMRVLLEYRYITSFATIAILIMSLGMVAGNRLPFVFLESSDAETVVIDVRMPIGTPLGQTRRVVQVIEGAARAQPEIQSISSVIGQQFNMETQLADVFASHIAQVFVELVPVEQRERESSQVIAAIRDGHGVLHEVESLRYSEIGGAGGGPDITIQVQGNDEPAVNGAVAEIKAMLKQRAGVYDIADDNYSNQREVRIALKPGAAALGFTVAEVARQVRGALYGLEAHVYSDRREDIEVRVRYDESSRHDLATIDNMWVIGGELAIAGNPNRQVVTVPLQEIAELSEAESYSTIRRIDRERAVTVTADTAPQVSPEEIMDDIQPQLDAVAAKYPGVELGVGGRQRDFAKAFASLPAGMLAALLMIYVILAWLFASYVQPLVVMLAIPFGIIGVIWGHIAFGYSATFLSLIGFIALCGIVVNNSLIFVQFFNAARREGLALREGLLRAGRQRLRPIVLTSLTTFLGLTPLMLEQSFQAKFLIPMAISISFGLLSSTILVLTMLPCFLVIVDDLKAAAHYLWYGLPRGEAMVQARVESGAVEAE